MPFDTHGHSFERSLIMLNIRWYLTYKLSYRDLKEMAAELGLYCRSLHNLSLSYQAHTANGKGYSS